MDTTPSTTAELILFDLGGVILDIDYRLTQEAFARLGVSDVDGLYSQAAQSDLFDDLERGRISDEDFRAGIRRLISDDEVTDAQIDTAWNALIQDIPPARLTFIQSLRARFKTALLSNTNEIHIRCFESVIAEGVGRDAYEACFDRIFYSSRIDARKPEPAAFEHVLREMGVAAEHVLFIDDSEQHIISARALGMQAILLGKGEEIAERLTPLLLR